MMGTTRRTTTRRRAPRDLPSPFPRRRRRRSPDPSSPISCKDGSGPGGGSRRGSRSRRCWEGGAREGQHREGEERRAVLRLLFLEGDGGATDSSFPYLSDLARSLTGSNQGSCRQNKVNMLIKNTLRLFVSVLTSAAQCWNNCTFISSRNSADGNIMVALCLDEVVSLVHHDKKRESDLLFVGNIR